MEKTDEELLKEKKDAEEAKKKADEEAATANAGAGSGYEMPQGVIDANAAAERMEKATAGYKVENDRRDESDERRALGGQTKAGQTPAEPPKETDEEFYEKVKKGEAKIFPD